VLRVTVEEVADSDKEGPGRVVGVAHIRNDGSGTEDVANYDIYLSKLGKGFRGQQPWRHGRLENFRRWQYTPWHLVAKALTVLTDLIGPIKAHTVKKRNGPFT
jgi:hypothetical protein